MYDGSVELTEVTLTTAAVAPLGTGPAPATLMFVNRLWPSGPGVPTPKRLSTIRPGLTGTKTPPVAEKYPMTSATTCVDPAKLKMLTCPPAPTFARTRLATVSPGTKL